MLLLSYHHIEFLSKNQGCSIMRISRKNKSKWLPGNNTIPIRCMSVTHRHTAMYKHILCHTHARTHTHTHTHNTHTHTHFILPSLLCLCVFVCGHQYPPLY